MSNEVLFSDTNPLEGAVRPACPNEHVDREFYESSQETAGWVRHHLVDDKWYRCLNHNCAICLADGHADGFARDLVGQILTILDILDLGDKQAKALKDLVRSTVYSEKECLELEMRRVVVSGEVPKEKEKA